MLFDIDTAALSSWFLVSPKPRKSAPSVKSKQPNREFDRRFPNRQLFEVGIIQDDLSRRDAEHLHTDDGIAVENSDSVKIILR